MLVNLACKNFDAPKDACLNSDISVLNVLNTFQTMLFEIEANLIEWSTKKTKLSNLKQNSFIYF